MRNKPTVYVIAGPNGAGKTTFAVGFLPGIAGCRTFVNADLIAHGISPLDVDSAAVDAGRIFLNQIREHAKARNSFAFETTLSGLSYIKFLAGLRRRGYEVRLYYLWIPTVKLTLKRIAERVRSGGHNIPREVAERRYGKGLVNLFKFYLPLTDYCAIFDNSSAYPSLIYEKTARNEHVFKTDVFEFIKKQLEALS